ncbi:MAG: nitroreductase family protein, partial [Bacillota bacterium]
MLKNLIEKNRSYRKFNENEKIEYETFEELINLARLSASAANRQPLKYIISNTKENNNKIFEELSWAGYIKDWDGPKKGERPPA